MKMKNKNNKKFGVFDFDGTIADTMPVYFELSSNLITREYNLDGQEFQEYSKQFTGIPFHTLFSSFLIQKGKTTERIGEYLDNLFNIANEMSFPFFEGVTETIEKMANEGVVLFISTGSQTQKTKERLAQAGLLDYFSLVYGSSEIEKGPRHIEAFAEHYDLSLGEFSQQSFFFGDGPGDMKIAKMCKMQAIGVTNTFDKKYLLDAGADIVVDKINDLLPLHFSVQK